MNIKMKHIIALGVLKKLALMALIVMCGMNDAAAQDKKELALQVAKVMPLEQQITDFTNAVAQTLPEAKQPLFKSIMDKNIDAKKLRVAAQGALLETFSDEELKVMADFYAKPEAASIMTKLGNFGEAMQPTIKVMVEKAIEDAKKAGIFNEE